MTRVCVVEGGFWGKTTFTGGLLDKGVSCLVREREAGKGVVDDTGRGSDKDLKSSLR